jgi:hypothetical protein
MVFTSFVAEARPFEPRAYKFYANYGIGKNSFHMEEKITNLEAAELSLCDRFCFFFGFKGHIWSLIEIVCRNLRGVGRV